MLVLAGLGLNNEKSLTLEELEEVNKADEVYIENYTSIWFGSLENLKKLVGKDVKFLSRKDLEEESFKIIEKAKNKNVLIFVPGDPLFATTHISLILECIKNGVNYKVLHNSSIISAIGETGIHFYKICKILTIPFRDRVNEFKYIRDSIVDRKDCHVVCLLDIDLEKGRLLSVKEALEFLIEIGAIDRFQKVVVASCIGTDKRKILYGEAYKFFELDVDLPAVIIIVGKLHFSEEEYLKEFSI